MAFTLVRLGFPNAVLIAALASMPFVALAMSAANPPQAITANLGQAESQIANASAVTR